MRKVFLMAALVLASTSGSHVCAMNEAVQEASLSELMPVKKTTKKDIEEENNYQENNSQEDNSQEDNFFIYSNIFSCDIYSYHIYFYFGYH